MQRSHHGKINFDDGKWERLYDIVQSMPAMLGNKEVRGTFFRTYGGGPEGGYIRHAGLVYEVERSWGKPFYLKRPFRGWLEWESDDDGQHYIKFERAA